MEKGKREEAREEGGGEGGRKGEKREGGNLQKVMIPICGGVGERVPPVRNHDK